LARSLRGKVARALWMLPFSVSWLTPALADEPPPTPPPVRVQLETIRTEADRAVATTSDGALATLTLRPRLQEAARRLLAQARPLSGAVVMVDVETGEVLALQHYRRKGARAGDPLLSSVPAASLFKLVTTTALFEHTRVSPKTRVCFLGGERQIDRVHLEPSRDPNARCSLFRNALGHSWNAVYA